MDLIPINGSFERERLELLDRHKAIHLPRTKFALRNFVAGMHGDACPKTLYQLLREATTCDSELKRMVTEYEEACRDVEQWEQRIEAGPQQVIDSYGNAKFIYPDLQVQKAQSRKEQLELEIVGKKREHDLLYAMIQEFPVATVEDMEADEARYWQARFTWQMRQSWLSRHTGFDEGNIMSIEQCSRTGFAEDVPKLPPIQVGDDILKSLVWQLLSPQDRQAILANPITAQTFAGIPETQGLINGIDSLITS